MVRLPEEIFVCYVNALMWIENLTKEFIYPDVAINFRTYLLSAGVETQSSAHSTTQYEKLAQDPSDEDVDDDVVFLQDGLALHQNGFTVPADGNHATGKHCLTADEAIQIGLLQKGSITKTKPAGGELIQVKTARRRRLLTRRRLCCCLLAMLCALATSLLLIIILPYYSGNLKPTSDWTKEYDGYGGCFPNA